MRKSVCLVFILIAAVTFSVFAAEVSGPTTIVLNYIVSGSDIQFRMVSSSDQAKHSVSEVSFGDISGLNHNQPVLSSDAYGFVYSYSLPTNIANGGSNGLYYGVFSLNVACSGLQLNGKGAYLISAKFVDAGDSNKIVEWPSVNMQEQGYFVREKAYGKSFRIKLENVSGGKLKAGDYSGVVSISMAIV